MPLIDRIISKSIERSLTVVKICSKKSTKAKVDK